MESEAVSQRRVTNADRMTRFAPRFPSLVLSSPTRSAQLARSPASLKREHWVEIKARYKAGERK